LLEERRRSSFTFLYKLSDSAIPCQGQAPVCPARILSEGKA